MVLVGFDISGSGHEPMYRIVRYYLHTSFYRLLYVYHKRTFSIHTIFGIYSNRNRLSNLFISLSTNSSRLHSMTLVLTILILFTFCRRLSKMPQTTDHQERDFGMYSTSVFIYRILIIRGHPIVPYILLYIQRLLQTPAPAAYMYIREMQTLEPTCVGVLGLH